MVYHIYAFFNKISMGFYHYGLYLGVLGNWVGGIFWGGFRSGREGRRKIKLKLLSFLVISSGFTSYPPTTSSFCPSSAGFSTCSDFPPTYYSPKLPLPK